jgi:hypothetical protein
MVQLAVADKFASIQYKYGHCNFQNCVEMFVICILNIDLLCFIKEDVCLQMC